MAETANDTVYADLLDALSPLKSAGIDPDEARVNPQAAMAKLNGPEPEKPWYEAQNAPPQQPGTSPNGNALPPGLNSRTAPQPAASVPASVTPTGDPTTLAGSNTGTINLMQGDYAKASQDVQNEAAQPDEATVTAPLEAQRVSAQRRQVELQNPYDPQTGKLLDEYKPNFATRFMRGVEGFARGGVLGTVNPGMTGGPAYGAPNKTLAIDQQQAAGRVAGADQQLTQAKENWKATNDRLKSIATERRALATMGKDVTGAADAQQKVPIEQTKADADAQRADTGQQEADQKDPAKVYERRTKDADSMKLKGQSRTLYLANGKLPDPRQATAEEIARAQATAAWQRDNPGKQPGVEDIRKISEAAAGREDKGTTGGMTPTLKNKILDEKNAAMEKATALYRSGKGADKLSDYGQQDWMDDMQAAQDKFEAAVESAGGTPDHMTINGDGSWKAESAAATPAAAKPAAQPAAAQAKAPPDALLAKTPEGGTIYGRGGEAYKKVKGKWQAAKP